MKFSPAALAITWEEVVPVVMDVPMVGRGIVMTGNVWLSASCCWAKGVRRAGWDWLCTAEGSDGVGVNDRGAQRESAGCGVEHGVLVGVGVDGLGVPDPKGRKQREDFKGRNGLYFSVDLGGSSSRVGADGAVSIWRFKLGGKVNSVTPKDHRGDVAAWRASRAGLACPTDLSDTSTIILITAGSHVAL